MATKEDRIKMIFKYIEHDRLNDWESKFIEDIEKYFNQKGCLTDNQYAKLEEIYERNN